MESKIGNKVKKLRLSLGMSQEEFGKKLGYTSRSSINKIEKESMILVMINLFY